MRRERFSRHRLTTIVVGVGILSINVAANATDVDGQAVFSGLILEACSVNVLTPGTLGVSGDQTKLSSEETGGIPATASVLTNSLTSSVQVIPPNNFTIAPAGADDNTFFDTSFELRGVTILDVDIGSGLVDLNLGLSTMEIDASATKTSGIYTAGAYSFISTVRCVTP